MHITSNYFYGNEVSDYGKQHNRVDYRTFSKAFDAVINNDIISKMNAAGYIFDEYNSMYYEDNDGNIYTTEDEAQERREELEEKREELETPFSEALDNDAPNAAELENQIDEINKNLEALEDPHYKDIFQFYIVSDNARDLLEEAGETYFYCEELDMLIWGVDHWGTSWDYVLTNITIEAREE